MILGEIARLKPADIDSKEAKLRLIKRLNDKGIFGVFYPLISVEVGAPAGDDA